MLIRSLVESDIDQILAFKLGYHETPWSKKTARRCFAS